MQELPEYWTAKNQNADFKFLAVEIPLDLRSELLLFLKNTTYLCKENKSESLKLIDDDEFDSFTTALLHILINSGYDSREKIKVFLDSRDADLFFKSLIVYPSISIFI
ncbi:MAG: hypothetical protein WCJ54_03495, partial [Actinomycetota bacterium]